MERCNDCGRTLPESGGCCGTEDVPGLTMTCRPTDENPHMPYGNMDHWLVRLERPDAGEGTRDMELVYSMGSGHNGREPTLDEVLECLQMDADSVAHSPGFEEWAEECGFDTDSRAAERTWRAVMSQAERFVALVAGLPVTWRDEG